MANMFFTPRIEGFTAVPISFMSVPKLTPDNTLAVLSTERYVAQNQSTVYTYSYSPSGVSVLTAEAEVTFGGTTVGSETFGGFNIPSSALTVTNDKIKFNWLNSPIVLKGIEKKENGSFCPIISTGMVWRFYRVTDQEPEWSWLKKAGLLAGDEVFLGYTVPEAMYDATSIVDASDPSTSKLSRVVEVVEPSGPNTIHFTKRLQNLRSIKINSNETTMNISPGESNSLVRKIDLKTHTIQLKKYLDPQDRITITYEVFSEDYVYTGFRYLDENDVASWHTCDLNPEYGREVSDPINDNVYPSSVALYNQVLLYLVPTCFCKLDLDVTGPVDASQITGSLIFDSALNYGETHFVRHYVGETNEQFDESIGLVDANFYNYWGIAPFGQSEYDEVGSATLIDDVFSSFLPSMMPIGKILLAGPGGYESLSVVDTRRRGGGVPEFYSPPALRSTGREEELQNLWDFGNWGGKLYHQAGTVRVSMSRTVLDTYTKEEVEQVIRFYLPPGVKYEVVYT